MLYTCNVNCTEIEQNIDLNKTEVFSTKTSKSLGIVYKHGGSTSSPTLYNSISISQNETNQLIVNNTQDNNTTNNDQSTIINITIQDNNTDNILKLNQSEQANSIIISSEKQKSIALSKQRTFSSSKDFRDYYKLYPYTPSELGLCGSLFSSWHSYWKQEVEKTNKSHIQFVEYLLSKNLSKTMSYISKLFNSIIYDAEYLKYNPYVTKYINKHLVNMDVKDPKIELFPEYYVNKYNKQCTDAITYVLYRTFSLLQYFLNSLELKENNYKSLIEVIKNDKNITKKQLSTVKQKLAQQLKDCIDNFNRKSNESKDITKKLNCYKQYHNSNQIVFAQIQAKVNKYTNIKNNSDNEIEKQEASRKLDKYNNKKTLVFDKLNSIKQAINEYKNKLNTTIQEIKRIKVEFNKNYKEYYDANKNMVDPNLIIEKINNNLEEYFDEKTQLDNELKNIYNNNKLLNPIKLNILRNNDNKNIPYNIVEIYNELKLQKDNINNYVEILKDVMKQLFKIDDKNK